MLDSPREDVVQVRLATFSVSLCLSLSLSLSLSIHPSICMRVAFVDLYLGCPHLSLARARSQMCSSVINQLFKREPYSAAVVTAVRTIDEFAQVRPPKLTVGFSQSSYILITYRVV